MRPIASTWVASMQNIAAPDSAMELMWVKCQSVATPSSAEYWHIGDTIMRFFKVRPRSLIGENRALMKGCFRMGREDRAECNGGARDYQRCDRHGAPWRGALPLTPPA